MNEVRQASHDIWEVPIQSSWLDADPELDYNETMKEYGGQSLVYPYGTPLSGGHRRVAKTAETADEGEGDFGTPVDDAFLTQVAQIAGATSRQADTFYFPEGRVSVSLVQRGEELIIDLLEAVPQRAGLGTRVTQAIEQVASSRGLIPRVDDPIDGSATFWRRFPGIESKVADVNHQQVLDANAGQDLQGLPGPVNVPGVGPLQFHSNADIQRVANEYNQTNGLGQHPMDYLRVNPENAASVAQEYEQMPHNPEDPQVKQSYNALAQEVRAQYDHAVNNGYNFEFYPDHDPYPNSPREAVLDLHHNKHMYVYPTETGYGSGEANGDHPLLGDSGVRWNGQPVTHNDLFRAVHDFYGHAKEGLGFRADGEDNAYRQHAAMFSPEAQRALASETRGQNSWVNYGPYGQQNQTAGQGDTVYAPQKAGIMPDWTTNPNLHAQGTFAKVGSGLTIREALSFDQMGYTEHEANTVIAELMRRGIDPDDLWGKWANTRVMREVFDACRSLDTPEHPDPWMDNEPGTLTLPSTWSKMAKTASTLAAQVVEATKRDGGITIGLNGQIPSSGYAFSVQQQNEVKIPLEHFDTQAVDQYVATHHEDLSQPGRYLGAWVNKDTVYLDVSQVEDDQHKAFGMAQAANQLAMYNLTDFSEIPITSLV